MEPEETDELDWDDVERFFDEYGCVMMNHPELRWYQESCGALMRSGLAGWTRFEDYAHAQTLLRLRAICLLAMYLGIYQRGSEYGPELGGCFFGHPWIWDYLEAPKVDHESPNTARRTDRRRHRWTGCRRRIHSPVRSTPTGLRTLRLPCSPRTAGCWNCA